MKKSLVLSLATAGLLCAEPIAIEKITVETAAPAGEKKTTAEELKTTRMIDVGEMLYSLHPEINMQRKTGVGGEVYIRGFRNDDINLLIDGNKVYCACPNRMDPPAMHVSTNEIDKITIKEGPFDVTTMGSLGGMIDVASKAPEKEAAGEAGVKMGDYGYRNYSGYATGGSDLVQAIVGFQAQSADVYKDGDGNKLTEANAKYTSKAHDAKLFDTKNFWSTFRTSTGKDQTLDLTFGIDKTDLALYPGKAMDGVRDDTQRLALKWKGEYLGTFSDSLTVKAYRNTVRHDMDNYSYRTVMYMPNATMDGPGMPMATLAAARSAVEGAKIANRFAYGPADVEVGLETMDRSWSNHLWGKDRSALKYVMLDAETSAVGVYADMSHPFAAFTLKAGVRMDSVSSESNLPAASSAKALDPVYGTGYDYSTDSTLTAGYLKAEFLDGVDTYYVGVGRTMRAPDPEELYVNKSISKVWMVDHVVTSPGWVGNPDLDPVTNHELDAGLDVLIGSVNVKANLFYSKLSDYVALAATTDGTNSYKTYANIDATMMGGDLSVGTMVTSDLTLELAAAAQQGQKDTKVAGMTDDDLADVPPMKTVLRADYRNGDLFVIGEAVHIAEQTAVDSDLDYATPDAATVFNLKAGYAWQNGISVNGGIDNLLDEAYALFNSYDRDPLANNAIVNEPGRFAYVNVGYAF